MHRKDTNYTEKNDLDHDLDCNLDCYLDLDPEDAPVYTGHSLFNITKSVTLLFIVQSLLHVHPNPPTVFDLITPLPSLPPPPPLTFYFIFTYYC